ncbi:unnamed protein product [Somion occarium]|uniref:C2H2-type domain-containing protein n=1 Tax=Somion occarium TaxID=3059160 RepID=A0ABP1DV36_9APHY
MDAVPMEDVVTVNTVSMPTKPSSFLKPLNHNVERTEYYPQRSLHLESDPDGNVKCPYCSAVRCRVPDMKRHIRGHRSNSAPLRCSLCNPIREFRSVGAFWRHQRSHKIKVEQQAVFASSNVNQQVMDIDM